MTAASEFQEITSGLWFWQSYERAVKTDLSCCACRTTSGLVFIDPIPLAAAPLRELISLAPPAAIVLTSGNHARAAGEFRDRFGLLIYAHAEAAGELGISIDQAVEDGDTILGELEVLTLPGAAAGEIALHSGDALHVGDALIHLEPMGFSLLPDKYCRDAKELRRSLGKLLRFDFQILTFAHGLPLVTGARHKLAALLS